MLPLVSVRDGAVQSAWSGDAASESMGASAREKRGPQHDNATKAPRLRGIRVSFLQATPG